MKRGLWVSALAGTAVLAGAAPAAAAVPPDPATVPVAQPMNTDWRCHNLPGTSNQLCLRIITDLFGNWTGVDTRYTKNQGSAVTVRLRWYSSTGQNGAGGWFQISSGQTRSHAFDGVNPRGCVHVALDAQGQGSYTGDPDAQYCS